MKDHEPVREDEVGGFVRHDCHEVRPLAAPIRTDALGTGFRYYARVDREVVTSSSVRALARRLGRVTLNPRALAEALAFGFVLRDETVLNEVRSVPPHTTLNLDATLTSHAGPRRRARITNAATAARELRGRLGDVIRELEPRWARHLVGFTGGKDSRILAAIPKFAPDRWHWLTVSGRDDAEHRGSTETAARLGLAHFTWTEWTTALGAQLQAAADRGESNDGSRYFDHWLAALEHLVAEKQLMDRTALNERKAAWADAYRHTPHGQPVELGAKFR